MKKEYEIKENKEEYRKNRDSNLKTEKEYVEREENEKKQKRMNIIVEEQR